ALVEAVHIASLHEDFALRSGIRAMVQPEDRSEGDALAGARLAQERQHPSRLERERDVVHRPHGAVARFERHAEVADGQQRHAVGPRVAAIITGLLIERHAMTIQARGETRRRDVRIRMLTRSSVLRRAGAFAVASTALPRWVHAADHARSRSATTSRVTPRVPPGKPPQRAPGSPWSSSE